MNKLLIAAFVLALLPLPSRAQDTPVAEVAAGYSELVVVRGISNSMGGGSGSVTLNVNHWLAAVGDFGAYNGSPGVTGLTAETYTFGPRFSYRQLGRVVPFAQFLLGGQHASAVSGGFNGLNAFAFAAGTGADIRLGSGGTVTLRPQVEYFGFRANGSMANSVRLSVGIVFRIGKKK
jgi:hypothetical protein